jgi:serine protease Do
VLKITAGKPLPFVKFGDSRASRVGDWVVAIGNPFGLGGTVTAGIISAVYRNTGQGGAYDRYLQTDAAINQGNSGGPMFDMKGQVIGINRAIFSPSGGSVGIGFAIPAETAAPIVDQLIKGQTIERGYLGVRIQPVTTDYADSMGLPHNRGELIQAVEPGKGADLGGVKAGDVVLKVDGKDVTRDQTLSFLVSNVKPGNKIPLEVLRGGQRLTLNVVVSKRPTDEELAQQTFDRKKTGDDFEKAPTKGTGLAEKSLGLSLLTLTPQISRQLGLPENTKGVVVAGVDASSTLVPRGWSGATCCSRSTTPPSTPWANLKMASAPAQPRVAPPSACNGCAPVSRRSMWASACVNHRDHGMNRPPSASGWRGFCLIVGFCLRRVKGGRP